MASKNSNIIFQPKMEDVVATDAAQPSAPATSSALIKCCICGSPMQPNASNICVQCLASRVDITEGITKQGLLHFCRQCERYLAPPWMKCELESPELLSLCLKKIKGLGRVKLIDASFVWTEPHSRRIKLKITIQKEVQTNTILQSSFIAELVVENLQCDDCKKTWTPHTWNSVVQLRQKVDHKRTILYLEQVILKHNMHAKAINVKEMPDGIDFFFATKTHALALNEFLHAQMLSTCRQSKQLVSADINSNDYNYKHTYYIEVAPICREDLVYFPPKLQKELGGVSPVGLVTKMATMLQILDPINQRTFAIDEVNYWSHEFKPICTRKQLSEYVVINVEYQNPKAARQAVTMSRADESNNYCYADLELQRVADFGENDTRFFVKTHLGNVLKIDDHVLGYDLDTLNVPEIEGMKKQLPDIIIVKKKYVRRRKQKRRIWKLKHIEKEEMEDTRANKKLEERNEKDYEEFLDEIEEDPELRPKINLYRDEEAIAMLTKNMEKLKVEEGTAKPTATAPAEETKEKPVAGAKFPRKGKLIKRDKHKKEAKVTKSEEVKKKGAEEEEWEDEDEDFPAVKLSELLSDLSLNDHAPPEVPKTAPVIVKDANEKHVGAQ